MQENSDTPSVKGKNYADFSRDELIAEINRLKKSKKYGLVWEHKTEEVIEDFKKGAQPYLKEVEDKRLELAPNEPTNLIIEGDNFDALSILNYTHAGKIDVIYIDPPYNTGNKDFIYNDNYVDSEDAFRHSKWLSFMEPRLRLAKNLLKEDGVIFMSIDDNEQASLKSLCDELFGNNNFVAEFVWEKKRKASNLDGQVRCVTEYILCYRKKISVSLVVPEDEVESNKPYPFYNTGNKRADITFPGGFLRTEMPDGTYKAGDYNDKKTKVVLRNDAIIKDGLVVNEITLEGEWRYSQKSLNSLVEKGELVVIKGTKFKPYWINNNERIKNILTLLSKTYYDVGTNEDGNAELATILGNNVFQFPKPTKLIKKITQSTRVKNAIVLDFFAGSGTTGHAVLELNKEDGGHRQFILCTNNGDKGPDSTKIAEEITYPRIKTVITGKRQDGSKYSDGIPANLRYYKIDHRQKKDSVDATRQDIVNYLEDVIKIKENTFKSVEANEDFSLYQNSEQYLGMVFDPFMLEEVIEKLIVINADKHPVKLYVFSYSRDAFEEDFGTDFEIEFVAMPEGLLKTYANIIEDLKKEDA